MSVEAWLGSANELRCSRDSEPIGPWIREHGENSGAQTPLETVSPSPPWRLGGVNSQG